MIIHKPNNICKKKLIKAPSTLFRMGGKKTPPNNFSPLTSSKVEISLQNFVTFSFNPFATLL